jgi:trigger factor
VAGREAQFTLDVKQVTEPKVPPLDEQFARAFGIASGKLEDLRSEVEANLKLELKRKVEAALKDQALKGLRGFANFALPRALVEQEAQGPDAAHGVNLHGAGHQVRGHQAHARAVHRAGAGARLARPHRGRAGAARSAAGQARPGEGARAGSRADVRAAGGGGPVALREAGAAAGVRGLAVEKNVVDWVLARARVTDVPTTFEQLMTPPQQGSRGPRRSRTAPRSRETAPTNGPAPPLAQAHHGGAPVDVALSCTHLGKISTRDPSRPST